MALFDVFHCPSQMREKPKQGMGTAEAAGEGSGGTEFSGFWPINLFHAVLDSKSAAGILPPPPLACDPLGQSRSTSDHTPRAPLWGSVVGGRKLQVTRPTDSLSSLVVGHPCPAAGARSTGHTQPPTRANHSPQENDKRCAPALKAPPPPQKDPPRHARLHIQARRYLPLVSALTRYGDRQQSGRL